jgi:hypothetical protein
MKPLRHTLIAIVALIVGLTACDLEKDIVVNLPSSGPNLVVESYIESGKPYRVLLTESSGYFEDLQPRLVSEASVRIHNGSRWETLLPGSYIDQSSGKFSNFATRLPFVHQERTQFTLEVKDPIGRVLTGQATLLPVVPLDTISFIPLTDTTVLLQARFRDNGAETNFYKINIANISRSRPTFTDFEFSDELFNGQQIPLQSRIRGRQGDTIVVRLFHINEDYYNFLQSVQGASSANGNPFAQPVIVRSTVKGGLGVFTAISSDIKSLRIE